MPDARPLAALKTTVRIACVAARTLTAVRPHFEVYARDHVGATLRQAGRVRAQQERVPLHALDVVRVVADDARQARLPQLAQLGAAEHPRVGVPEPATRAHGRVDVGT